MKIQLWLLGLAFSLTSCQQMTKQNCEGTNWRKEAFLYALNGEKREKFNELSLKCKSLKVDLDQQVFNEGFDEGAAQFCNPSAGFEWGKAGYIYKGTCKTIKENEFLKSYIKGRLTFLRLKYSDILLKLEESDSRVWRKKNEYELESNTNPNLAVKASDELESFKAENERIKSELEKIKMLISELQKESVKDSPRSDYPNL